MMGNNLQALNTAKSITKQLAARKQHLSKTNDRQIESNLSRNKANSESSRQDVYGVTSNRQLSSAYGSEYFKEASNGLPVVNFNTRHLSSCGVVNDTSNLSSRSSFVYYGPVPQDNREGRPKNPSIETTRDERKVNTVQNQNNKSVETKKCPVVVDLTIDDSDDDDDDNHDCSKTITQDPPSTLPKILDAFSLNSKHSSFPNSTELCTLLSQRAKENVVNHNGIVINSSTDISKCLNTATAVTDAPLKNGVINQTKHDVISSINELTFEPLANLRNDVMNDVTNLRNGDLSNTKKSDLAQMVFTNWSVRHDMNVDSNKEEQGATPMDTGDQVIITKVVTSTEKSLGRKHHPRKTPIEVRELYFDEKTEEKQVNSTTLERDSLNKRKSKSVSSVERAEKCSLEETDSFNGNIRGTPWSFTMNSDDLKQNSSNSYRENKIRNLKDRLAKQQEEVEKLRTKERGSSPCLGNGILVVKISDLKEKLRIQSKKKQSFRVIDQSHSVKTNNKRKRKTIPRKVGRQSQAECDSDGISDETYLPQKRTRSRIEKEAIKQRLPKRPRGRCSPATKNVPVVTKDVWHREMEKVEAELASSNRPIDQASFLLFLGLRRVETS